MMGNGVGTGNGMSAGMVDASLGDARVFQQITTSDWPSFALLGLVLDLARFGLACDLQNVSRAGDVHVGFGWLGP